MLYAFSFSRFPLVSEFSPSRELIDFFCFVFERKLHLSWWKAASFFMKSHETLGDSDSAPIKSLQILCYRLLGEVVPRVTSVAARVLRTQNSSVSSEAWLMWSFWLQRFPIVEGVHRFVVHTLASRLQQQWVFRGVLLVSFSSYFSHLFSVFTYFTFFIGYYLP